MPLGLTQDFTVVGISARLHNFAREKIGTLWCNFYKANIRYGIESITLPEVYCVYHEYEGTALDPYVMTLGYRLKSGEAAPAIWSKADVPAQDFELFQTKGRQPKTLISKWQEIWESDLDRAYVADFDLYDARVRELATVYLGIKAR